MSFIIFSIIIDVADEQLSQVDVDKVDQVVEQLQVEGNTVGQTASNAQGKWGYVIDLEWEAWL